MDRGDGLQIRPQLRPLSRGWQLTRRIAGYGAAATLSLYLFIKVTWVAVALLTHTSADRDMTTAGFVALNAVTIAMAAVGVALGIGLASERGRRVPVLAVGDGAVDRRGLLGSDDSIHVRVFGDR